MQQVRWHDPLHNRYLLQQWQATWVGADAAAVSCSHRGAVINNLRSGVQRDASC